MPIHDLSYRHWAGEWTSHPYRWLVITRQGIKLLAGRKRFLILMFLSAIPFLVRCVMLYGSTLVSAENIPFLKIDPKFFASFLSQQMFFVFIIAIYAGSGLIANDLKANALQIYFSKPITRRDYLMGKLGVLVFFLSLPTLVPGVLLLALALLFRPQAEFVRSTLWLAGPIVGFSLLIILSYGLIILALSSLSRSSRFAGINFAAIFFFGQIFYGILWGIFRTTKIAWVSVGNNLSIIGDALFRLRPEYSSPPWLSGLLLLVLLSGCVWIVHKRIRAVEVVR